MGCKLIIFRSTTANEMKIKHSTSNSCPYAAHLADISGPSPLVDMTDEEVHSDHDTSGSLDK